jgi:hypothetical protein
MGEQQRVAPTPAVNNVMNIIFSESYAQLTGEVAFEHMKYGIEEKTFLDKFASCLRKETGKNAFDLSGMDNHTAHTAHTALKAMIIKHKGELLVAQTVRAVIQECFNEKKIDLLERIQFDKKNGRKLYKEN